MNDTQSGGMGLIGVLLVVFIVLKLTGNIAWSWLWVLSPLWIPFAVFGFIIVVFFVTKIICDVVLYIMKD